MSSSFWEQYKEAKRRVGVAEDSLRYAKKELNDLLLKHSEMGISTVVDEEGISHQIRSKKSKEGATYFLVKKGLFGRT